MDGVRRSSPRRMPGVRTLASFASLAAVLALIVYLPRFLGTSWAPVGDVLAGLSVRDVLLLTGLWFAGLLSYTFVLTSSLPGLSHARALLLNLTGSAVSNLTPFGGAAGVGLNFAMVRAWRFSRASFATFTTVSNLWDWLGKLVLSTLVLGWILSRDFLPTGAIRSALVGTLAATGVVLLLLAAALVSARLAYGAGWVLDRAVFFRPTTFSVSLPQLRRSTVEMMRAKWMPMTLGVIGYSVFQAVLLWACLHVVGSDLAVYVVLAGFSAERLLTMVPLTPGGAGFADAACAAVLVALGGPAVPVAAAVVLYRGFTFLLEIPVGGLGIVGWLALRGRKVAV